MGGCCNADSDAVLVCAGIEKTLGVPSLIKVLLPEESHGLCSAYLKGLLLNPPPLQVAVAIQGLVGRGGGVAPCLPPSQLALLLSAECCQMLAAMEGPYPDMVLVEDFKLTKLLRAKEINAVELRKVQRLAEGFLSMEGGEDEGVLSAIRERVLEATWMKTGLRTEEQEMVNSFAPSAHQLPSVCNASNRVHLAGGRGQEGLRSHQRFGGEHG